MELRRRRALRAVVALMALGGGYGLIRRGMKSPFDRKDTIRSVFAPGAAPPRLSAAHLALMRNMQVMWLPIESGAPMIDVWQPLAGAQDVVAQAMTLLASRDEEAAVRTLAEVGLVLVDFVQQASLAPGRYAIAPQTRQHFADADSGVDGSGQFEFRREHRLLLQAAQWRVIDSDVLEEVLAEEPMAWPLPYIDGKRPYGENSYYQIDMADVLGTPYRRDEQGYAIVDHAKDASLEKLHFQMQAALQVFLQHATPA
jgi:hypothetical protein